MSRITNEQFQFQVLEIHSQYLQILELQKIKENGKSYMHNYEFLHSSLTNLISMLSDGQKSEISNVLLQVAEIRKEIFTNCGEEYKNNLKKQAKRSTKETKSRFGWEGCGGGESIHPTKEHKIF